MKAEPTEIVKEEWVEVEYNHRHSIYKNIRTGETKKVRDPAR